MHLLGRCGFCWDAKGEKIFSWCQNRLTIEKSESVCLDGLQGTMALRTDIHFYEFTHISPSLFLTLMLSYFALSLSQPYAHVFILP